MLSCDVRDTVFQGNVFALPPVLALTHSLTAMVAEESPPPNAGYGNASLTILEQPANKGWLKDCFGEQVWPAVAGKPIVCSGHMVGHPLAVQQLAGDIVETFQGRCPGAPQHGLDQGILNWLVHVDARPRDYLLQVVPNGHFVLHAHVTAAELHQPLVVNGVYEVVNNITGQPYPAVHQYDRLGTLKTIIRGMYPLANVTRQHIH